MGKKSTIELNGKRYNAATGAVLGDSRSHMSVMDFKKYEPRNHSGRALDGFKPVSKARPGHGSSDYVKPVKATAENIKPSVRQMDMVKAKRTGPAIDSISSTHKPQHANTLMRSAVKKPNFAPKPAAKAQLPAGQTATTLKPAKPPYNAARVDVSRMQRAQNAERNRLVNRFGGAANSVAAPNIAQAQNTVNASVQDSSQLDNDIFEVAVGQATSHEQKSPKVRIRRSPLKKVMNGVAIVCAALVIAVFIAYLNMPNIELHFASTRAGFHAMLPGYKSLGFSMDGPISSSNGVVAMSFQSGDSHFTLTQQSSNWDNQTLLDSTTNQSDTPPRVLQGNGRTIYVSTGNHATWVSGGIRYDISGDSNLSDQQITSIADSM